MPKILRAEAIKVPRPCLRVTIPKGPTLVFEMGLSGWVRDNGYMIVPLVGKFRLVSGEVLKIGTTWDYFSQYVAVRTATFVMEKGSRSEIFRSWIREFYEIVDGSIRCWTSEGRWITDAATDEWSRTCTISVPEPTQQLKKEE